MFQGVELLNREIKYFDIQNCIICSKLIKIHYLEVLHAILISTPNTRLANIDAAVCNTVSTRVVFAGAVIDDEDDFDETLVGATVNIPLVKKLFPQVPPPPVRFDCLVGVCCPSSSGQKHRSVDIGEPP